MLVSWKEHWSNPKNRANLIFCSYAKLLTGKKIADHKEVNDPQLRKTIKNCALYNAAQAVDCFPEFLKDGQSMRNYWVSVYEILKTF